MRTSALRPVRPRSASTKQTHSCPPRSRRSRHAHIDVTRARALTASGDAPQQSLDDATTAWVTANAQVRAAGDAVALAEANRRNVAVRRLDVTATQLARNQSVAAVAAAQATRRLVLQRKAQLDAAIASLAQARATLGLARDQVRETAIRAPFTGTIISHNFENGELVQAGAAALTIGDLDHPYAYVYIGESDLPRIKPGQHADVRVDGLPNHAFNGIVTEINNQAEFTPENVQTKEQRVQYLVFRVKLQFTDTTGLLKPGLPVDALIHTSAML